MRRLIIFFFLGNLYYTGAYLWNVLSQQESFFLNWRLKRKQRFMLLRWEMVFFFVKCWYFEYLMKIAKFDIFLVTSHCINDKVFMNRSKWFHLDQFAVSLSLYHHNPMIYSTSCLIICITPWGRHGCNDLKSNTKMNKPFLQQPPLYPFLQV